jgi:curved DNA-binding protein
LNVKIPKGVKQGQRIRLTGQGSPGLGKGQAGDLYLEIEFKPHKLFKIEGRDLYLDLPVSPWEAALGATVKAPTPEGPVDLKIPQGTTAGRKLRLRKRGIPGTPPGDLYANLTITLPAADSDAAKELYRKMEKELAYNPRSELGV